MIRAAKPSDIPALSELAKRTWADAFGSSVSAEDAAAELEETRSEEYFEQALQTDTILVAELGSELRAYVQFGNGTLRRLYVDTELQGRGIGGELLEAALEHPRLADAEEIRLQVWEKNERALRLYERYGFRIVGTTRFTIGREVVEDLVLVRRA